MTAACKSFLLLFDHIAHTTYVDAVYCYCTDRVAWSVGRSVGQSVALVSPAKMDELIINAIWAEHLEPHFPQTDIIGAVVIVWRARGKTIRSVLCSIVCNNCTQ